ncbi:MAG: transcriptional repressor [Candidatus Aminicenantales bacterium]
MEFLRIKSRENHLKATPQRIVIYKELLRSKDHPYAEIIFHRVKKIFPDISMDTVNRTLLTFARIGIVNVVEGNGEPRRYDPNIENHHHFRCVACNTIFDFGYSPYDELIIPEDLKDRFVVRSKKVLLEGYCDKCQKKGKSL